MGTPPIIDNRFCVLYMIVIAVYEHFMRGRADAQTGLARRPNSATDYYTAAVVRPPPSPFGIISRRGGGNKTTQKQNERALARYTPPTDVLSALEALSRPYVRWTVLLP
jgi:hypothetical protein